VIIRDDTSLVDIHSHLVPGVDDGARDVSAVLESVGRMMEVGIRRIVTTPHIQGSLTLNEDRLESRLAEVTEAFELASEAVMKAFPEVEFRRGHEVMVDVPEPNLGDPRIRMAGTSFVLLEWPRLHVPPGTPRVLRWIRDQGYYPVVAHPERYVGVLDQPDILHRWKDAGAYLQVNYGSFVGRYGTAPQSVAYQILEAGLADYLSSDFHGHSQLKLYKREAWDALGAGSVTELLETLCRANPSRLIEGLEPLPAGPLPATSRIFKRLRGMMRWRDRAAERPIR